MEGDLHAAAAPGGTAHGRPAAGLDGLSLRLDVPRSDHAPAVVRHALGGVAAALGMDAGAVADLRLAASEVATALVEQARAGATLSLEGTYADECLRLLLRAPARADAPAAVPLGLLVALTRSVELRESPAGDVEVAMTFPLRRP